MSETQTMNEGENKILVTGATGNNGRAIVRELARRQVPVRVLVRNPEKASIFSSYPNVEIFEGDMLKSETLRPALSGVKKVLMISTALQKMVETQISFIEAAKRQGNPHVIKYSGAESGIGFISGNFIPMAEHEKIEDHLVNSGLSWTMLRPSQFMQLYLPGSHSGVNMKKDALILPVRDARLSPVAIEDVAKVCAALLTQEGHEGKFFEMTGPEALSMSEICEIISEVAGRKISYIRSSLEQHRSTLTAAGLPEHIIGALIAQATERMKCTESYIKLDTHRRFGVRPTGFAEFIYKNAGAFKAND